MVEVAVQHAETKGAKNLKQIKEQLIISSNYEITSRSFIFDDKSVMDIESNLVLRSKTDLKRVHQAGVFDAAINDSSTMDEESNVVLRNKKDVKRIRQCRVVFSYKQDHEDELNLRVGDVIAILGEEEEGWWRGILHGKVGVFPSNFVEEINTVKLSREDLTNLTGEIESLGLPPKPAKILCQAIYSYKSQNDDELNLKEGDIVTLLSKDGHDPGWWKGELNGIIGVFPDNFVIVMSSNKDKDKSSKEDKKSTALAQELLKPSSIASQRRSLENKSDKSDSENKTPPVPGKKPSIVVKKSPSASSVTGGLFSGIKKKIVDVVDGATSSKAISPKTETTAGHSENVFDQVERVSLLSDVRATRAKAPGRRPPSIVFKEEDLGIPNGGPIHANMEVVSENSTSNTIAETDTSEVKPKLREWEKHKAPWLAEMKLNQAKRTSPGQVENKVKLTPSDKLDEEDSKPLKVEKEILIDMSKSMPALDVKSKSSPTELENPSLATKAITVATPRPLTVQITSPIYDNHQKPPTPPHPKVSPLTIRTPSPLHKLEKDVTPPLHKSEKDPLPSLQNQEKDGDKEASISFEQYSLLLDKINRLELQLETLQLSQKTAIEELKGKLQIETEMRHMLQVTVDRLTTQNVMQV